jgi:hypothetical protein
VEIGSCRTKVQCRSWKQEVASRLQVAEIDDMSYGTVGLLSVCLVLASGGCRPSQQHERLPVYPVRGQVFYQGRPAAGALVRLHPLPPTPAPPFLPRGLVGADGSFTLTTDVPRPSCAPAPPPVSGLPVEDL